MTIIWIFTTLVALQGLLGFSHSQVLNAPYLQAKEIPTSCSNMKALNPKAESGVYVIRLHSGLHTVYCEMAINGGGYTFLSSASLSRLANADVNLLVKDSRDVLLRISQPNGAQPYTVIKQIRQTGGLSVQFNRHSGYASLKNTNLGPYIYLGTLPISHARNRNQQGFISNNKQVKFRNSDANPNAYFAFFSNPKEKQPTKYLVGHYYEQNGVAVDWRGTAKRPFSGRRMPYSYFLFTEMHFGGSGTYTSSDRWLSSKYPALGTAIGLR